MAGAVLNAASATLRFGVSEAGMASARDPGCTVRPQRERVPERERLAQQERAERQRLGAAALPASPA